LVEKTANETVDLKVAKMEYQRVDKSAVLWVESMVVKLAASKDVKLAGGSVAL